MIFDLPMKFNGARCAAPCKRAKVRVTSEPMVIGVFAALASFASAPAAFADDLSCKNIEWIVGWGAGGGSDSFARSIAPAVDEALGTSVTVINMPGAASIVAMEEVVRREADGCTLFSITPDQLANELNGLTDLSYTNLAPVMRAHVDIGMLHASESGDLSDWQAVTERAETGEPLIVGGTGAASFDEIVVDVVLKSAGVPYRYIPYESASDMHTDLIGGRLDLVYDEVSVMDALFKAEQVRPVLTLADKPLKDHPDVAAAGEVGVAVPPSLWRGVSVKAGTPQAAVAKLEAAFLQAANSETYQEFEEKKMLNLAPGLLGAEEFKALLEKEHGMYAKVISKKQD